MSSGLLGNIVILDCTDSSNESGILEHATNKRAFYLQLILTGRRYPNFKIWAGCEVLEIVSAGDTLFHGHPLGCQQ